MKKSRLLGAVCATAFSVISMSSHAAILSYGGYTHDTTTDIVTGNGLEWLQWDVTIGESIDSIQSQLGTLEGGGWSVASNVQMAELFNAFNFGITFDVDENTSQQVDTGYQYPDTLAETDQLFIAMFGDTYGASAIPYCYLTHCVQSTSALFGRDTDEDSLYNAARVFDDYQNKRTGAQGNGYARITNDYLTATTIGLSDGVALVRDISAVPVPAAVWLFGSGLIGLVGLARRKR